MLAGSVGCISIFIGVDFKKTPFVRLIFKDSGINCFFNPAIKWQMISKEIS
ncbi:hypothetical protein F544_960 [Bibersteinia trehalosi USDA-ARS-USMARC-190]|uniref:Uncharacterized protein n=1 Tax=Bibersteinia trehalosi USDA-ARS-USMARC-190 TaxID=1263832 RepID=W0R3L3_BIBTR|nr:hypothetical protein F544_960 [Bibersteinia trehalosi USDA-ARS-USMARC-190]